MHEDLIAKVQDAIEYSLKWADKGWPVKFGGRGVKVSSLKEARDLPDNFVYRLEAISYWEYVEQTGMEAAAYGRKALDALKQGDLKSAEDALYFSQYIEKPFALSSKTWRSVHKAITDQM